MSSHEPKVPFGMNVDRDLRDRFSKACGDVSQATVTRKLWQLFVAMDVEERLRVLLLKPEDVALEQELKALHRRSS